MIHGASAFSPAVRKLEREFEKILFEMQEARVRLLFEHFKQAKGLDFDEARRTRWMYTGHDVYRMLGQENGWTPGRYLEWLSESLVSTLVGARYRKRQNASSPRRVPAATRRARP